VADLRTLPDAQRLVLERVTTLPAEPVPLGAAAGRVLAEDALAAVDLPPFPSSAMDGFAVRAADTPGSFPVVSRIAAGSPVARALEPGEAMEISTGGVVPEGADAVVPVEYVVDRGNEVEIPNVVDAGDNVRPRGGDVGARERVCAAGTRLSAARIGALAAVGLTEVRCTRRPRVVLLATGSELRRPGEPLAPGQIYESNGEMLAVALAAAGAEVERHPPVADDEDAHRAAIARGLEADVLVSSGGVSMGPHDLVRTIEAELGVDEVFWGIAVKPGKPVSFGVRDRTLVFGLPGNPVSSLVAAELLVKPALLALQGLRDPLPLFAPGRLGASVRRNGVRDELMRARLRTDGTDVVLDPVTGQESHMIVRAAGADALVFVPRGEGEIAAGETVRYLALG
jgi:molybdopterin molybdotransferase